MRTMQHQPSTPPNSLRIPVWNRRAVYASLLALVVTGGLWLLAHYLLRTPGEYGELVHPLEPWSMKLHGGAAMFALFFTGSILHSHIRRAIRSGRNRGSGWAMVIVLTLLTLTGYWLYYFSSEETRPMGSLIHWAAGTGLCALLLTHVWIGRQSRH
ncbi:DUF4405 domain-containing protein [Limnobacter humi]|uniref:DUF4405 domain-containing protein n=1 Tax=Limnobacter humi TaxID=1778671 RepID=A0ABT1WGN8_9BURK|nr:DUF4405 domain-containing protein [Limnobacter humi]MCQ8896687.1 DUF4405 domain-containing protein [Limnobacter humi]